MPSKPYAYRKADPDCPKCKGRGVVVKSNGLLQLIDIPGMYPETWKTRCTCTDTIADESMATLTIIKDSARWHDPLSPHTVTRKEDDVP